jgi:hypothetical protein
LLFELRDECGIASGGGSGDVQTGVRVLEGGAEMNESLDQI